MGRSDPAAILKHAKGKAMGIHRIMSNAMRGVGFCTSLPSWKIMGFGSLSLVTAFTFGLGGTM